ncbi:malate:quinone oxidoreductase [Dyadobacter sp. CY327]|uniref:malate:quinone oxidoreductase n=1 Tax=Dyadobacter sp. CY327 TaxID=2907301 RepID=UPI0038D48153
MPGPQDRLEALKDYLPETKLEDWDLEMAGQRVQVIMKDKKVGGVLEFGTKMVTTADGSLAASHSENPFLGTLNWQLRTHARTTEILELGASHCSEEFTAYPSNYIN